MASHIAAILPRASAAQLAGEVSGFLFPEVRYTSDFSTRDFRYGRGEETETGTFTRKNGIVTHYFTNEEVLTLFSGLAVQSLVQHQWEMRPGYGFTPG